MMTIGAFFSADLTAVSMLLAVLHFLASISSTPAASSLSRASAKKLGTSAAARIDDQDGLFRQRFVHPAAQCLARPFFPVYLRGRWLIIPPFACAAAARAPGCATCWPSIGFIRAISSGRCSSAKARAARSRSRSLPGVSRWSVDRLAEQARRRRATLGIPCIALFPNTPRDAAHATTRAKRSTPTT